MNPNYIQILAIQSFGSSTSQVYDDELQPGYSWNSNVRRTVNPAAGRYKEPVPEPEAKANLNLNCNCFGSHSPHVRRNNKNKGLSMDHEKQKDEVVALESIYNEEFSYQEENGRYKCVLKIVVTLPQEGYYFTYKDNRNANQEPEKVAISHLPPLELHVTLPPDYPSASPPKFTIKSCWLSPREMGRLCARLDELWIENCGQEILFVWMAFLQNETLDFLKIRESLDMSKPYTFYRMSLEKAPKRSRKEPNVSEDRIAKDNEASGHENDEDKEQKNNVFAKSKKRTNKRRRHVRSNQPISNIDRRVIFTSKNGDDPVEFLIDFNEKQNQIEFKKNFYTCNICFSDKSGEHSTRFVPCCHVFCEDCVIAYLKVKIDEGTVQSIRCPEEKCTSEATPGQIKDLVSPELFAKYDSILLSATLDTMSDIIYCPRRHCQYPVSREPNEQMASCPVCQYTFCVYCKMVYHGVEPCKINSEEKMKLLKEYKEASNEKKKQIEDRYGKKQLRVLFENAMSENWINTNSRHCPHCNAAIEKSDGCNKMTCWRCNTFFCWLCGTRLNPKLPYLHFQNPESKCFNMLYHGLIPDVDDEDWDDEDDEEEMLGFPALYLDFDTDDEEDLYNEDFVFDLDV